MHIYAFGSICRGEVDYSSDIDLLAIVSEQNKKLDPNVFSIYSYERLTELWNEGNPFAWHLAKEAKLIYSSVGEDIIKTFGDPIKYNNVKNDCEKFYTLFCNAVSSIDIGNNSLVFDLSAIFLAIRNFATCYALGCLGLCEFSRFSAQRLGKKSLEISNNCFDALERSRILSSRGYGEIIYKKEIQGILEEFSLIDKWMNTLLKEI